MELIKDWDEYRMEYIYWKNLQKEDIISVKNSDEKILCVDCITQNSIIAYSDVYVKLAQY